MSDHRFYHSSDTFKQMVRDLLARALERGASDSEAEVHESFGQNVTVRRNEVETIEYNRDKALAVTVYVGHKRGHATSSVFTPQALCDTVDAALSIARFTGSDDCAGLADKENLATEFPDLDLYHPWNLPIEDAIALAKSCEAAAFAVDKRINNSEGASVGVHESQFVYGNSRGFLGGYPTSRHSVGCAVIAGHDDGMQRDDWYTTARASSDLEAAASVGAIAGRRTIRRLDSRQIKTSRAPVLFEAPVAAGLIGHLVAAASGGSLYRKSSFLLDALGKQVFSPIVQISDLPHSKRGLASSAFDDEGVATRSRDIVNDGVLQGYFLGSYSARKLGMQTTGNAGGNHNLVIEKGPLDLAGLMKKMDRGLLVTEVLGQGVNLVTGDYSRGVAGFWIEHGEVAHAVDEITIAGNLKNMFRGITDIGSDVLVRGSKQCPSILIDNMTIAGN
ncbi:MAG: metalloprotease PmbA [Burkholderiales bacterium]|nr:metalloprotease PmbA [Burkholderiales bacterium]